MRSLFASAVLLATLGLAACGATPQVERSYAAMNASDYVTAESELNAALSEEPDNLYAKLNLGVVYHQTGRHDEARALYEEVVAKGGDTRPGKMSENVVAHGSYVTLADIAQKNIDLLDKAAQQ